MGMLTEARARRLGRVTEAFRPFASVMEGGVALVLVLRVRDLVHRATEALGLTVQQVGKHLAGRRNGVRCKGPLPHHLVQRLREPLEPLAVKLPHRMLPAGALRSAEVVIHAGDHGPQASRGLGVQHQAPSLAQDLCVPGLAQGSAQPPQLVADRARLAGCEEGRIRLECRTQSSGRDTHLVHRAGIVGVESRVLLAEARDLNGPPTTLAANTS